MKLSRALTEVAERQRCFHWQVIPGRRQSRIFARIDNPGLAEPGAACLFGRIAAPGPEGLEDSDGRGTRPPCLQPNPHFSLPRTQHHGTGPRIPVVCGMLEVSAFSKYQLLFWFLPKTDAYVPPRMWHLWTFLFILYSN